ncbi:protein snail homolog Sna [Rhipicephalus sanguineus]|uniref:C2H2-type domain-containing protein n=1 Tax=Rhipicephalus sanguineus TaxID=34632 RepID=A0A9D4T940_RHISA|nr:protein snail homolog Sna [Rhipicephalus sanguineus]KAH7983122.1 hypothetical protein HPB52_009315 [Rhipicephalus sanguineus]
MPRSFLIKKHVNAGATALSRPVAVVKRPWLDDSSHEAEDLSTSPPPVVRVPVALSPALSDGCVPDIARPFDLSLKAKRSSVRSEYPSIHRPVAITPPPGVALIAPKGDRTLDWPHQPAYLAHGYMPLTLYPMPAASDYYAPLVPPPLVAGHPMTPRELAKQSPPQRDAVVPSWSSGVSSSSSDEKESRGSPVPPERPRRRPENAPRYPCTGCNRSYSTYSGLSKHRQFHCSATTSKSFSCKYCEKDYSSLGALKMHIRTHTLPCKCKLCGKAFSRPWLLQGHIRTHTGEKPFACPHCSRAFADRSNLRAHLQTHSDIKKYSCKSCSRTFSRMSLLLKHEDGGCPAAALNRSQPKP